MPIHPPESVAARDDTLRATPLQRDILRTLLYFDIFSHPLSVDEIFAFLPSNSIRPRDVADACEAPPLRSLVHRDEAFYFLKDGHSSGRCVEERAAKEERAKRVLRVARRVASVTALFPFVRGVFVTGELSKGVSAPTGDIDLMVITAPGRLWVARTLLIIFKKLFLFNSKRYFCLNQLVSEDDLSSSPRNVYTATEVGTVVPLVNHELYEAYIRANAWIDSYLPNLRVARKPSAAQHYVSGFLQRAMELPFRGSAGDALDVWLMERWKSVWRRRYPRLTDAQRESVFRCERGLSTAYVGDFLPKVLSAYAQRLESYGLNRS